MIYGKIIGAVFGFLMAGPFGLIMGLVAGHFFDQGLSSLGDFQSPLQSNPRPNSRQRANVQVVFFDTNFQLMGHLAKADGRVSEDEIAHTETIIRHMGLNDSHRQQAIALFKRGSSSGFQLQQVMDNFKQHCGGYPLLQRTLLNFLISTALADGELHPAEQRILENCALQLGISSQKFQHMLNMAMGQQHFQQQSSHASLDDAYQALGVSPSNTDKEIKRAYRKLISENHPDKLIAQGVPEDMIKLATEKAQEIQGAYDSIKKARK